MTTAARSSSEPDALQVIEKRSAAKPKARTRRPRTKKPAAAVSALETAPPVKPYRDVEALRELALTNPQKYRTQVGTLLVGAGIGAAVTLSIVALGTRRGGRSALGAAVTKSIVHAIAHTTPRGSPINLLARAVGNALA
jgi:hypothetical protein